MTFPQGEGLHLAAPDMPQKSSDVKKDHFSPEKHQKKTKTERNMTDEEETRLYIKGYTSEACFFFLLHPSSASQIAGRAATVRVSSTSAAAAVVTG